MDLVKEVGNLLNSNMQVLMKKEATKLANIDL